MAVQRYTKDPITNVITSADATFTEALGDAIKVPFNSFSTDAAPVDARVAGMAMIGGSVVGYMLGDHMGVRKGLRGEPSFISRIAGK